jgi:serine protease Do
MKRLSIIFLLLALIPSFAIPSFALGQTTTTSSTPTSSSIDVKADVSKGLPDHLKTSAPKTLGDVRLFETHIQKLLEKIRPATVSVGGGTGVVVSKDGYILTCAHVNREAGRRVRVRFPDGKTTRAITLGSNKDVDGGMMKITEEGNWPYVELGDSKKCELGQWCLALGFPVSFDSGKEPPARLGRVLSSNNSYLATDCTIMGGDSGGPLFDMQGRVIAIHSRVNNSVTRNIHVPVNSYTKNWDRLLASEEWSDRAERRARQRREREGENARPYLGVWRDNSETRALVSKVVEDSAAEIAGIQAGDEIVEFDNKSIRSFDHLLDEIAAKKPGDRVKIRLKRNGVNIELRVRLGKK